jgi:hypothetical protein
MNEPPPNTLATTAATTLTVVEHLISLASGMESEQWLAKYVAVQRALAEGNFADAVREHSKLIDCRVEKTWVASRGMERIISAAMSNLAWELKMPNSGRSEIRVDDLPSTIDERGTIAAEEERSRDEFAKSLKRDPLEADPKFTEILAAADRQAESELESHPLKGGIGFCHVYWQRKQAILKETYGLEWHSPADLNLDTFFD